MLLVTIRGHQVNIVEKAWTITLKLLLHMFKKSYLVGPVFQNIILWSILLL